MPRYVSVDDYTLDLITLYGFIYILMGLRDELVQLDDPDIPRDVVHARSSLGSPKREQDCRCCSKHVSSFLSLAVVRVERLQQTFLKGADCFQLQADRSKRGSCGRLERRILAEERGDVILEDGHVDCEEI